MGMREMKRTGILFHERFLASNSRLSLDSAVLSGLRFHLLKLCPLVSAAYNQMPPELNRDSLLFNVHDKLGWFLVYYKDLPGKLVKKQKYVNIPFFKLLFYTHSV